jgi:hypothetical protein
MDVSVTDLGGQEMTQYDPKIIYKFAVVLYSRARTLVIVYTLIGVLIGASFGKAYSAYNQVTASPSNVALSAFGLGQAVQPSPPTTNWTLIGILVVGLLGFWTGWNKAFVLKLQAQTALCQVKIEENTNPSARGV